MFPLLLRPIDLNKAIIIIHAKATQRRIAQQLAPGHGSFHAESWQSLGVEKVPGSDASLCYGMSTISAG